ncbi:hypothetical protein WR25_17678 [Diploscapter pachys]|uniref:glucuronosyltransferase n=1 Tax=Diploscapter pachys TaxID=2018661 RepID=A0A2A2KBP0_9BILA|nr:hypothetical protein WR25_17678 [Diploscapter pachys]
MPGTGTEKANYTSYGPDPRAKILIENSFGISEFQSIWTMSSNTADSVLWAAGFIGEGSQYTCEMFLDDHDLLNNLKEEKFDMAITELFDFSGLALFHAIGITNIIGAHSSVHYEFTSLLIGNPVIPSYIIGSQSYARADTSLYNRAVNLWMSYVSWLFPRQISLGTQRCMDLKWGKAAPTIEDIVSNITWIYANTEPLFDFSKPVLPTVVELGGIGAQKPKPLDEKWSKILSKRRRNVLISFGSVAQSYMMPESYKQSMVKLFEQFPDITFIWKYEKPEENNFVKHLDNVHLSNWLPQNDILGDPRISLFITHGGAGSVFESAMNGVPVLTIPMFGDQMRNAKIVERHGFGLEYFKLDIPKSDKLVEAAKQILTDESYKKNAKKVAELFASRPFSPQEKLKIPFASPPLKELRFALPRPPKPWNGIRDATKYGPACLSNSSTTKSPQKWVDEDCLHVNVFTNEDCIKSANCAVAFYVHGGGLQFDSAVMFNDSLIIESFASRDVIFITVGFRLGIFSHLVFEGDDVVHKNIGIYDLLAGLEFMHSEIRFFGGNKSHVTLYGHSYGGGIAVQLATSKKIDPKKRMQRQMEEEDHDPPGGIIRDEILFPKETMVDFLSDTGPIRLLIGTTTKEMDMDPKPESPTHQLFGEFSFQNIDEVRQKFYDDWKNNRLGFNHKFDTQYMFQVIPYTALSNVKNGGISYLYSYRNPKHPFHTDDLSYLLGVHSFEPDNDEKQIGAFYREMFSNFVKTGVPDNHFEPLNATLMNYLYIDFDNETGLKPHMENDYEHEVGEKFRAF